MKHTSPKKKMGCLPWFGAGLLGIFFLAVGSLYTPYPIELVKAIRNKPEPEKKQPKPKPEQPAQPPKPEKPAEPEPVVVPVVETAAPWRPDNMFTMPDIVLPPFPPALPG